MKITNLLLAVVLAAMPVQAEDLFVFGDSLSDNGNLFLALDGTFPSQDTYFWGRASDGPTWTERLGYSLGNAPNTDRLQAPFPGFRGRDRGYNYAHFGALVTPEIAEFAGQDIGRQVSFFQENLQTGSVRLSGADRGVIWAGANDYLALGSTDANAVATAVRDNAVRIADSGLGNILVLDQPLWGFTPIGLNRGDPNGLNRVILQHNTILTARVAEARSWGFDVHVAPISQLYLDAYLNPGDYGFSVVRPGIGTTGHCLGDGLVLDECPDTYAFYDEIHPTGAFHSDIAQFLNAQWGAINASRGYSGVGTAAASPVLAFQSAALSNGSSLAAAPGFVQSEIGPTTAFAFNDRMNAPAGAIATAFDQLADDERFQLVGVSQDLTNSSRVSFAYSSGSLQGIDQTARRATRSNGWAMQLEQDTGRWTLSLNAMESNQTIRRSRPTGFDRDPVATAEFDQRQRLTTLGIQRNVHVGGWLVQPQLAAGTATRERGSVIETARTNLVTRSTAAEGDADSVTQVSIRASRSGAGSGVRWSAAVSASVAKVNGDALSAWSVLGATDFVDEGLAPVRQAERLTAEFSLAFDNDWSAAFTADAGQGDGQPQSAVRFKLSKQF